MELKDGGGDQLMANTVGQMYQSVTSELAAGSAGFSFK